MAELCTKQCLSVNTEEDFRPEVMPPCDDAYMFKHKDRYLVISLTFCFSLIPVAVLGNKFVVFGQYGTQS